MSTLTLERIRATALAIVDQEGASRLTMRRVADRLDVEAPSLYHHVDSKSALVDGIVDALLDEVQVPSAGGDAEASLRALAGSLRAVMDAHPNAVRLVGARPSRALALVGRCEPVLAALAADGASPSRALDQLRTVILFVLGHAEVTHGGGAAITADDDSPRVATALAADGGPDRWFDHGLDAILAGFAQPAASVAPSRSAAAAAAAGKPRPTPVDDDSDEGHAASEATQDAHDSDDAAGGDQAGRHADEGGQDEDAAAASSTSGDVHGAADEGGAEAHAPGDDQDGADDDGADDGADDDATAAAAPEDDHGHDHGHSHDHGRDPTPAVPPPAASRPTPRPTPAPPPAADQPRGIARRLLRRALRRDED